MIREPTGQVLEPEPSPAWNSVGGERSVDLEDARLALGRRARGCAGRVSIMRGACRGDAHAAPDLEDGLTRPRARGARRVLERAPEVAQRPAAVDQAAGPQAPRRARAPPGSRRS